MIIKVRNTLHENAPKTSLSTSVAAGVTTLAVKNTAGLTTGWGVQIGEIGEEQAEVLAATVASGTSITLSATSFPHPADTPVYFIKYDRVVFERSTTGTAGTASPLTNGTVTYQADNTYTLFDDTTGDSSYAYRTYFRSSGLASNSTESDWITSAGFPFYSLAKLRERMKRKLWSATYVKEDEVIDDWVNEWKDEMSNAVISLNEDYALGTVNVPFGTNGLGTITTGDFKDVRRVWVTYNGSDKFKSTKMSINDYLPDQIFSSAHPYHAFMGDNVLQVKPEDSGGTAELVFYRFGTTMVNDTDELPQPFRSYTKSFVDYGLSQAYYLDGKDAMGDRFYKFAIDSKDKFVSEMSPRDESGPTYIDLVEPISGDDGMSDIY